MGSSRSSHRVDDHLRRMRAAKETGATVKSFVKSHHCGSRFFRLKSHRKFGDDFEGVDSAAAGKGLLKQKIYSKYEKLFTFFDFIAS